MSTRRLEVVITGDASSLSRAFGSVQRDLGETESRSHKVGRALAGIATTGVVAGFAGLAAALGFGAKQMMEQEAASARTANVLKTTGGVAGVTQKQIEALASALQDQTGTADDVIQSGENLLLTFTNIRNEAGKGNDVFTQATRIANDLSVALGQDMKSSAIQVGKALNDPIKGITALQRVGVSFTAAQRDQIKALVEGGHRLDAQKLILRELQREFGGAASSQGRTTESVQRLQRQFETFTQFLAARVLPVVADVIDFISRNMPAIQRATENAFRASQRVVAQVMAYYRANILPTIQAIVAYAKVFWARFGGDVKAAFALVRATVGPAMRAIGAIITGVLALIRGDWGQAWASLKTAVQQGVKAALAILHGLPSLMLQIGIDIGKALVDGILAGLANLGSAVRAKVASAFSGLGGLAKSAIGSINPFERDGPDFALRHVGVGTATDLTRVEAAGARRGDLRRRTAVTAARAGGADDQAAQRAGDRAYDTARLATIRKLSARILRRRGALVKTLAAQRTALSKVKVNKHMSQAVRQAALDKRSRLITAINAIEDELETLATNYYDLQNEAANLGADIADLDRAAEADAGSDTSFTDASAPDAASTDTSVSSDAQAQIDQAAARQAVAEAGQRAADAFIRAQAGVSIADAQLATGGMTVIIQGSVVRESQASGWLTSMLDAQASTPATTIPTPL